MTIQVVFVNFLYQRIKHTKKLKYLYLLDTTFFNHHIKFIHPNIKTCDLKVITFT